MSGVDVRMDFPKMTDMASAYGTAAADMDDCAQQLMAIPKMLEQGALIGDAAVLFEEAVSSVLAAKIKMLADKLRELKGDMEGAEEKTRTGESKSAGRFA